MQSGQHGWRGCMRVGSAGINIGALNGVRLMTNQDSIHHASLRARKSQADRIMRIKQRLDEYRVALRSRKLKYHEHYYACSWDDIEFLLEVLETSSVAEGPK